MKYALIISLLCLVYGCSKSKITDPIDDTTPVITPLDLSNKLILIMRTGTSTTDYGIYYTDTNGQNEQLIYRTNIPIPTVVRMNKQRTKVAYGDYVGKLWVISSSNITPKLLYDARQNTPSIHDIAWSPSGDTLAFIAKQCLILIKSDGTLLDTLNIPTVFALSWNGHRTLDWSITGDWILFSGNNVSGSPSWPGTGLLSKMHPDGTSKSIIGPDSVQLYNGSIGNGSAWARFDSMGIKIVYCIGGINQIKIVDTSGVLIKQMSFNNSVERPIFSHDGTQILFTTPTGTPGGGESIYKINNDGTGLRGISVGKVLMLTDNYYGIDW
ncbi:MAG: PD40 domain-containing protein [Fibrobacteres bacterium]|nr:PD40 domain-containing protein [Fibrobacterota bacterium]